MSLIAPKSHVKQTKKSNTIHLPPQSLQERLALLQWQKKDIERKMKETIQRSKEMKEVDLLNQTAKQSTYGVKREWMESTIQDELDSGFNMEVSGDYVRKCVRDHIKDWKRETVSQQRLSSKLDQIQAELIEKESRRIIRKQVCDRKKTLRVVLSDNFNNEVDDLRTHPLYIDTSVSALRSSAPRPVSQLSVAKVDSLKEELELKAYKDAVNTKKHINQFKSLVKKK